MEGSSLSVADKIKITRKLDELGVAYIEGGLARVPIPRRGVFSPRQIPHLSNSTIAAFGSTRRAGVAADQDANLKTLIEAETPVITL